MKKLKGLLGLAVSLMLIGVTGVSAKTYDMETDMNASEFDLTEDTVINGNGHTITGRFNINTEDISVVINDVTIDVNSPDNTEYIGISLGAIGTSLELNNVTIINYTKSGIYADQFASLVVNNSVFDGSRTPEIGEGSGDEAELVKRSAAGIDINIGNSAKKEFSIDKIEITNSTFRNVLASESNTTGGGIKVKIKNNTYLTSMCDVVITNNTFTDNVRDLVVGTDSGAGSTTQAQTGDITFKLFGNSAMKIVNNSSSEAEEANRTEVIDSKYLVELNYYEGVHNTLTEDESGIVVDATDENFDLEDALANISANDEVENLVIDYGKYTITINKEDIKEDLANTLTDLSLVVSEDTTTDALLEYISEDNAFIKTTVSGELPANVVTLSLNLSKYANQNVNLYYFNPDNNELEFVSVVTFDVNGNANIALEHYSEYVLSLNDLTNQDVVEEPTDPVEEPTEPSEPDIENPSTSDNIGAFMILGALSVIGLTVATIVLKKKHN